MLTKGDDYPIHQTPEPIAYAGTDRNFYDRYFFNGYSRDGEHFFAVALGVYPHLNIMDASFCLIHEGTQHNVHASRVFNMERMDTHVGPISVKVIEPLQILQVRMDENEYRIKGEVMFQARAEVIEEPRFIHRIGPRTVLDYTRLTQHGTYSGWLEVDGERIEISTDRFLGTRDRSWGIRPIGAGDPQPFAPPSMLQFYWLWAPLHFDDCVTLYDINADADGSPWHQNAVIAPLGEGEPKKMASSESMLEFKAGTRHAKNATLVFRPNHQSKIQITLEPQFHFYMIGLGYLNPEWGHGIYKGDNVVGYESLDLNAVNDADPSNLHIQAFCRAFMTNGRSGERQGVGVLEQLIIGPHKPSGFKDLVDTAP
jgi:hypothetical protein